MADTAVLLEIITYIFQRTPPTADCDEPLTEYLHVYKRGNSTWNNFTSSNCSVILETKGEINGWPPE